MFQFRRVVLHSSSPLLTTIRTNKTEVSAAMVKKLRELSSAPLMDCKAALSHETVQGDIQKALDWLRAKGIAKANQSKRETKEGLIAVFTNPTNPNKVTLVEVNCETDFVSMNQDFQKFVASIGETVNQQTTSNTLSAADILPLKPTSGSQSSIEQALGDIVSTIRETIVIKRATNFTVASNAVLSTYVHNKVGNALLPSNVQVGKAAGLISFAFTPTDSSVDTNKIAETLRDQVGRKLAMHVVAAKPLFLQSTEVPQDFIEKEMAIFREQSQEDVGKKKPEIIEKMIQGKLNKRYAEVCLLGQNHMAEEGNPVVKKYVDGLATSLKAKVDVNAFALWTLNN